MHSIDTSKVFVREELDAEGDLFWAIAHLGRDVATTYSRAQLDSLLDALNRPVRWLVPAA